MCQGMGRKKGHVISEMGEPSMSLSVWSCFCCWCSPKLQVTSWAPPEEPQAVGETLGFLKRIHLGSTQSSPCMSQQQHAGNSLPTVFSYQLITFTLVENIKVMSRAKPAVDKVRKGPENSLGRAVENLE